MFYQKTIKNLRKEIEVLKEAHAGLNKIYQTECEKHRIEINRLMQGQQPMTVNHFTVEAAELCRQIQMKYPKQRRCGHGSCGDFHNVDAKYIESVITLSEIDKS